MKLRPNSMPTQIVSGNRESASKAAASLGREFVAWVSGIFMFLGIAAICRWVWPGKKGLADATTFIVFLLWITLIRSEERRVGKECIARCRGVESSRES